MKINVSYSRKGFLITIIIALFILCCCVYLSGLILQWHGQVKNIDESGNSTQADLKIDASFELDEVNVSIVNFINSTPVTYLELQKFPELESSMHGINNDPAVWHLGYRVVRLFDGNLSLYNSFVEIVCQGKSRIECNGGMLFEYHEQYYRIFYMQPETMPRAPLPPYHGGPGPITNT